MKVTKPAIAVLSAMALIAAGLWFAAASWSWYSGPVAASIFPRTSRASSIARSSTS